MTILQRRPQLVQLLAALAVAERAASPSCPNLAVSSSSWMSQTSAEHHRGLPSRSQIQAVVWMHDHPDLHEGHLSPAVIDVRFVVFARGRSVMGHDARDWSQSDSMRPRTKSRAGRGTNPYAIGRDGMRSAARAITICCAVMAARRTIDLPSLQFDAGNATLHPAGAPVRGSAPPNAGCSPEKLARHPGPQSSISLRCRIFGNAPLRRRLAVVSCRTIAAAQADRPTLASTLRRPRVSGATHAAPPSVRARPVRAC